MPTNNNNDDNLNILVRVLQQNWLEGFVRRHRQHCI